MGITSAQARRLLREGNERFMRGQLSIKDLGANRRKELTVKQEPFAVVVCCADSRVPPEIVFDVGLGEIFVVRAAANIVDAVGLGTVEFVVEYFDLPLVVVLGHEKCGGVTAVVEGWSTPGSMSAIVEEIRPLVSQAQKAVGCCDVVEAITEMHVAKTLERIEASPVLKARRERGDLDIVSAIYRLESGRVEWLADNTSCENS